jgi:acetyl esterase/lipase
MSVSEALKGAIADIQRMPSHKEKLRGVFKYFKVLGQEVLGIVAMVPYAARSYLLYANSLQEWKAESSFQPRVSIRRDVRYGKNNRNHMDIYVPATSENCPGDQEKYKFPIALFCHGGVWASGSKWHYAPLACLLAQCGIITAVMEYSLYPDAKTDTMVGEVSEALDWVLESCGTLFDGDGTNVTLIGHSAGAHLCCLALLKRAKNASRKMPRQFVGMAGVYNIERHFEYERQRGVEHLSTMERAVGGKENFFINSPSAILRAYMLKKNMVFKELVSHAEDIEDTARYHGDEIPTRAGLMDFVHSMDGDASYINDNNDNNNYASARKMMSESEKVFHDAFDTHYMESLDTKQVSQGDNVCMLPSMYLMASSSDMTVPWYESSEFHRMLQCSGMKCSRLLLYNRVGHGDFVVDWYPAFDSNGTLSCSQTSQGLEQLPPFASDLLRILKREDVFE